MTPASGRPLRRTIRRGRALAKVAAGLAALAALCLLPAAPAAASAPTGLGTLTLLKTYTSVQYGWQSVQPHGTEGNPLIYPQCGGYVSTSNGIQFAISHGSLVSTILQAGVPATVPTYLLCGGSPTIPEFYNENRGPSDGVVFEASCEETTGIGDVGAVHLIGGDNHLMLGWEPTAESIISSWLS